MELQRNLARGTINVDNQDHSEIQIHEASSSSTHTRFDDFLLHVIPIAVIIGIINERLAGLEKRSIIKNCLNKGIYPLDRILKGGETSINRYRLIIDVNG